MPHSAPTRRLLLAALLAAACASAQAAPFSTTSTGTISASEFPGIAIGTSFSVTLIFDNGGNTALGQSWGAGDLTCAIWRVSGGTIVHAQPPTQSSGSAATGADGVLSAMFSTVEGTGNAGDYTSTGSIALNPPVRWLANGGNPVFIDGVGSATARAFSASAGGVRMGAAYWTPPRRVMGGCDDTPVLTPPPPPTPVPTLGDWGLLATSGALLSLAGGALRRRRRV